MQQQDRILAALTGAAGGALSGGLVAAAVMAVKAKLGLL